MCTSYIIAVNICLLYVLYNVHEQYYIYCITLYTHDIVLHILYIFLRENSVRNKLLILFNCYGCLLIIQEESFYTFTFSQ